MLRLILITVGGGGGPGIGSPFQGHISSHRTSHSFFHFNFLGGTAAVCS